MQETIFFKNRRNVLLSASLNNGRYSSPVVVFVHGFGGNRDENGLFVEAETFFNDKGYNTFRFDMEGAGQSNGTFIDTSLERQVSDLNDSLDFLKPLYPSNKIGLIGFSLGATISILAQNHGISAYSFWSPAFYPAKDMFPRYNTQEVVAQLKKQGYIIKSGLQVGSRIIDDIKNCDIEQSIHDLREPALLVHGTEDSRIDYHSTIYASNIFKTCKLELITGANHSYKGNSEHRRILFDKTYSWFEHIFWSQGF